MECSKTLLVVRTSSLILTEPSKSAHNPSMILVSCSLMLFRPPARSEASRSTQQHHQLLPLCVGRARVRCWRLTDRLRACVQSAAGAQKAKARSGVARPAVSRVTTLSN